MCLCVSRACLVLSEVTVGSKFPGTEVIDGCEPPDGCWELNLVSLREQQVLLTIELPLQLLKTKCLKECKPSNQEAKAGLQVKS